MAETHDFEGSTHNFGPPPGYECMVGGLHVFHNGVACVTAWKPSPEDLKRLNAGESIFVSMWTGSRDGKPLVVPMFVGTEDDVLEVVSDTGKVWK